MDKNQDDYLEHQMKHKISSKLVLKYYFVDKWRDNNNSMSDSENMIERSRNRRKMRTSYID